MSKSQERKKEETNEERRHLQSKILSGHPVRKRTCKEPILINSRNYRVAEGSCTNDCGPEFFTCRYLESGDPSEETVCEGVDLPRDFEFELMWEVDEEPIEKLPAPTSIEDTNTEAWPPVEWWGEDASRTQVDTRGLIEDALQKADRVASQIIMQVAGRIPKITFSIDHIPGHPRMEVRGTEWAVRKFVEAAICLKLVRDDISVGFRLLNSDGVIVVLVQVDDALSAAMDYLEDHEPELIPANAPELLRAVKTARQKVVGESVALEVGA